MREEKGIFLRWATAISIVLAIAATVTAHFDGIRSANEYTDKSVSTLKTDVTERLNRIEDKQDKMLIILKR